ncbi:hypothetical protein GCM10010267_04990 [Streptomyces griseorubens]|nr:hypothetical protein GCM10010267_04990 [Streptomyces griseorubens]
MGALQRVVQRAASSILPVQRELGATQAPRKNLHRVSTWTVLADWETAVAIPPPGNYGSRASTALQAPAFRGGPSVAYRTGGLEGGPVNWEDTHRQATSHCKVNLQLLVPKPQTSGFFSNMTTVASAKIDAAGGRCGAFDA